MIPDARSSRTDAGLAVRRALAAGAVLWALLSVLPIGSWLGMTDAAYYRHAWGLWGRTLLIGMLASVLALVVTRGGVIGALRATGRALMRVPPFPYVVGLGVIALIEGVAMAVWGFARNPQSVDAWAQFFQARVFASGALTAPLPASLPHFTTLHVLTTERGWFSQFPPVHPALLAAGMVAGAAWLVTPLLGALLPGAVYLLGTRTGDARVARVAGLLALLSPFVIAMSASGMNHVPAALCVAVGLWAVPGAAAGARGAAAVLGVTTGVLAGIRPFDALVLAVVGGLAIVPALRHRNGWATAAIVVAAALPVLVPTLLFNAATTGDPLRFGYTALYGDAHRLGFHVGPWETTPFTPRRALGLTSLDAHQLNVYVLEWPLPVTLLAAAASLLGLRTPRRGAPPPAATAYLIGFVGALFFYFHRDTLYGPRLLFSIVGPLLVLVAASLVAATRMSRPLGWRGLTFGDVSALLLVVVAGLAAAQLAPLRLASYSIRGTALAAHPAADAVEAGITRALVLMPDGWGSRLIARMWASGIPMGETDRLYHALDACTLEERLTAAEHAGLRGDDLRAHLRAEPANPGRVARGVTRDPFLRLPADRAPSAPCTAEIARDQDGGVPFAAFLSLNAPTLDASIVWAREMGPQLDARLRALYPDRPVYRYRPAREGPPHFVPVTAPAL